MARPGSARASTVRTLDSRVLIEQAKGVLMERHGLDDDAAFTRLRRQARTSSRKVVDVAHETIAHRTR